MGTISKNVPVLIQIWNDLITKTSHILWCGGDQELIISKGGRPDVEIFIPGAFGVWMWEVC